MLERAKAMLRIGKIMDSLPPESQRIVAYEVYRTYGGPLSDAERASRYRDRLRHEKVTGPRDDEEAPPAPVVTSTSSCTASDSKASKQQHRNVLTPEALDKAKALLDAGDFEFLQSCPEPFRTQWLADPDWWLSLRDGYPRIKAQGEASKCMAYVQGKFSPAQIARLNLRERLRRWIAKADMWREHAEERKAVRR